MKEIQITYYLIRDRQLAKRESDDRCRDYLFLNGKWEPDRGFEVSDHLIGYDPYEPPGSPYAIGCLSIMDEMRQITEQEAMELIALKTREAKG